MYIRVYVKMSKNVTTNPDDELFLNVSLSFEDISFDEIFNATYQEISNSHYTTLPVLKLVFGLAFRVGMIFIQLGIIPIQNVYFVLIKHILEIGVGLISYTFIGFILSQHLKTVNSFCGYGIWINDFKYLEYSFKGYLVSLMGGGIICCNLSARMNLIGLSIISFFYSGFIAPIIIHWCSEKGLFAQKVWSNQKVSVKDHGNILSIHLTASVVCILGIIFLSRRIIPVRSIDPLSIGLDSITKILVGYLFMIIGLFCIEWPSVFYELKHATHIAGHLIFVNNLVVLGTSFLLITLFQFCKFRTNIFSHICFVRSIQAGIAAMVAISGGVDLIHPIYCFFIAILSTALFFIISLFLHHTAFEDPLNVVAIHFVCGLLGHLCAAILGAQENLGIWHKFGRTHIFWQICTFIITFVFVLLFFVVLFVIISALGLLRTELESRNHQIAMGMKNKKRRRCFKRLFNNTKRSVYFGPTTILLGLKTNKLPYELLHNEKRWNDDDQLDKDLV